MQRCSVKLTDHYRSFSHLQIILSHKHSWSIHNWNDRKHETLSTTTGTALSLHAFLKWTLCTHLHILACVHINTQSSYMMVLCTSASAYKSGKQSFSINLDSSLYQKMHLFKMHIFFINTVFFHFHVA